MNDECLICKAPLVYLEADEPMECAICHKRENSKTRCVNGHYVCNECHTQGLDAILALCLGETSKDPASILEKMMALPFCHMHGPEHHVMVGAALLTAYKNAGGELDLNAALTEMMNRGKSVPGGACGFWGACGAGISSGMFVSIVSGSTPLSEEPFALSHRMTAKSLEAIAEVGGPRCCKRDSYLSILAAVDFTYEHLGVEMEKLEIVCTHSAQNSQCIGKRCPFSKARHTKSEASSGGEVSFDIPNDFYLSMTSEELAEKCWRTKAIIANGVLAAFMEKAKNKGGFLLDFTKPDEP